MVTACIIRAKHKLNRLNNKLAPNRQDNLNRDMYKFRYFSSANELLNLHKRFKNELLDNNSNTEEGTKELSNILGEILYIIINMNYESGAIMSILYKESKGNKTSELPRIDDYKKRIDSLINTYPYVDTIMTELQPKLQKIFKLPAEQVTKEFATIRTNEQTSKLDVLENEYIKLSEEAIFLDEDKIAYEKLDKAINDRIEERQMKNQNPNLESINNEKSLDISVSKNETNDRDIQ